MRSACFRHVRKPCMHKTWIYRADREDNNHQDLTMFTPKVGKRRRRGRREKKKVGNKRKRKKIYMQKKQKPYFEIVKELAGNSLGIRIHDLSQAVLGLDPFLGPRGLNPLGLML